VGLDPAASRGHSTPSCPSRWRGLWREELAAAPTTISRAHRAHAWPVVALTQYSSQIWGWGAAFEALAKQAKRSRRPVDTHRPLPSRTHGRRHEIVVDPVNVAKNALQLPPLRKPKWLRTPPKLPFVSTPATAKPCVQKKLPTTGPARS
jgi:hypothetical protein